MVADYGVNVSPQTIKRRQNEFGLYGRIAQKKTLLSIKNVIKRLQFRQRAYSKSNFWNMIAWSDESKFNVFESDGKPYVRRPPNKQLDPKHTKKTVKHGGASIMVWFHRIGRRSPSEDRRHYERRNVQGHPY